MYLEYGLLLKEPFQIFPSILIKMWAKLKMLTEFCLNPDLFSLFDGPLLPPGSCWKMKVLYSSVDMGIEANKNVRFIAVMVMELAPQLLRKI